MKNIINNPLFRICGIGLILYYGLFNNKHNPDSLNNRLAPERIKANTSEAISKSMYIIDNVKKAEQTKNNPELNNNKIIDDEQK